MTHEGIEGPRHVQAAETLKRFNRDLEIESIGQNVSEENISGLVEQADIVFSCT